jgi:hypothetical protein
MVHENQEILTCYDNFTSVHVEDYIEGMSTTSGWSIGVYSHSKTTTDFSEQYFVNDSSLFMSYKHILQHSLALVPPSIVPPKLSW